MKGQYIIAVARAEMAAPRTPKPGAKLHAVKRGDDKTMCTHVDTLDLEYVKHSQLGQTYSATCTTCLLAMKIAREKAGRKNRKNIRVRAANDGVARHHVDHLEGLELTIARYLRVRSTGQAKPVQQHEIDACESLVRKGVCVKVDEHTYKLSKVAKQHMDKGDGKC
jgi:hypothetical protein